MSEAKLFDRILLNMRGSDELAVVASKRNFGTEIPAFLRSFKYINPKEWLIVSSYEHFLRKREMELPPPLKVQMLLDFIENRVEPVSFHKLLQDSEDMLKKEGILHGEEEK